MRRNKKETHEMIIRQGNLGEDDIVAFDLEISCNRGFIWCIDKNGGSEACLDYFHNTTKPDEAEAESFIRTLENNYDISINRKYRLSRKKLNSIWS